MRANSIHGYCLLQDNGDEKVFASYETLFEDGIFVLLTPYMVDDLPNNFSKL